MDRPLGPPSIQDVIQQLKRYGINAQIVPSRIRRGCYAMWLPDDGEDVRFDPMDWSELWWTVQGIIYGLMCAYPRRYIQGLSEHETPVGGPTLPGIGDPSHVDTEDLG